MAAHLKRTLGGSQNKIIKKICKKTPKKQTPQSTWPGYLDNSVLLEGVYL